MPDGGVADATVLIFLGKRRRLEWLRERFSSVFVPETVYKEVVVEGRRLGAPDAGRVADAIEEGWIVVEPDSSIDALDRYDLEAGERSVLSLALNRGDTRVLVDEESVREVARLHGLEPRGTLNLLVWALDDGRLTFDAFLASLQTLLDEGFYLHESVYLDVVRRARAMSAGDDDRS